MVQRKKWSKKYWNMGGWKKLPFNERQQIIDDLKTWSLGHKKNSGNGHQAQTNKTNMNRQKRQLQDSMYTSKKRLVFFPDTASESD